VLRPAYADREYHQAILVEKTRKKEREMKMMTWQLQRERWWR
jgi:hypothetical protein